MFGTAVYVLCQLGLELRASVEIHVLLCEKLDGHVVDRLHFLAQDDGFEKGVYAAVALLIAMLRYEEGDAALAQTFGILCHHVISHNLYVATVVSQEIVSNNMGF